MTAYFFPDVLARIFVTCDDCKIVDKKKNLEYSRDHFNVQYFDFARCQIIAFSALSSDSLWGKLFLKIIMFDKTM